MGEDKAKGVCGQEKATQGGARCYSDCRGKGVWPPGPHIPVFQPCPLLCRHPIPGGFRGPGEQQAGELHPKAVAGRCSPHSGRGPQGPQGSIVLLETECRAPMT